MPEKMLQILLKKKIDEERISYREASRQIGVSVTTVIRVSEGEDVYLETLEKICKWLEVAPSGILDSTLKDVDGLAARMSAVLQSNPELMNAFERAMDRIMAGSVKPEELERVLEYMAYEFRDKK